MENNQISEYINEIGNFIGQEGYSIAAAAVSTLLKAKGELVAHTIGTYKNTRFNIRLEDFAYEEDNLTDDEKKEFYRNIDNKKLNYLFELLDKARTSTYDLHAKILAKLYGNLLINGELNYFQSTLLENLNILNEHDITYIAFLLYIIKEHKSFPSNGIYIQELSMQRRLLEGGVKNEDIIIFSIKEYSHYYTYKKCLQLGIFIEAPMQQAETPYGMQEISELRPLENRRIQITENTLGFITLLREIFR